jgi:hypothetical protein
MTTGALGYRTGTLTAAEHGRRARDVVQQQRAVQPTGRTPEPPRCRGVRRPPTGTLAVGTLVAQMCAEGGGLFGQLGAQARRRAGLTRLEAGPSDVQDESA